jgi:hypothetical protein
MKFQNLQHSLACCYLLDCPKVPLRVPCQSAAGLTQNIPLCAMDINKTQLLNIYSVCGPGSSVSIATGYGLHGLGIESRWGARFSASVQAGPGAHPASYTTGTGSFPEVKQPGRGVDHPPSYSAEVKEKVDLYP